MICLKLEKIDVFGIKIKNHLFKDDTIFKRNFD